jgi:hypothetical protein
MDARLKTVVKDREINLESFMEVWSLLSSKGLLQALEASAGKKISLFIAEGAGGRVEMLLDVAAARVGVDLGQGVRWGRWTASGAGAQISLEDGGECRLTGTEPDSVFVG